jgi:hypothetical protein
MFNETLKNILACSVLLLAFFSLSSRVKEGESKEDESKEGKQKILKTPY